MVDETPAPRRGGTLEIHGAVARVRDRSRHQNGRSGPPWILRGGASQKGNLMRYTRYLAHQLTVGDYREQGFVGTPV